MIQFFPLSLPLTGEFALAVCRQNDAPQPRHRRERDLQMQTALAHAFHTPVRSLPYHSFVAMHVPLSLP